MSPDEDLVTVTTFANVVEAGIARGALEACGIPAFARDEAFGTFAVIAQTRVELEVRADDRDTALDVLGAAGHQ